MILDRKKVFDQLHQGVKFVSSENRLFGVSRRPNITIWTARPDLYQVFVYRNGEIFIFDNDNLV